MRGFILIVFFFSAFGVVGQTRRFNEESREILSAKDSTFELPNRPATEDPFNFISEGSEELESIFLAHLKVHAQKRPDELEGSKTLSTLSELAVKFWKGSVYSDKKKWSKLSKHFKRASNRTVSKFNILKEVSFRIPLVDDKNRKFYYDSKGSGGGLNLYFGKKPRGEQERDEAEQIPLPFYSETELLSLFIREVKRQGIYADLKRGLYAYVGLHVEIDQNSINKNKIPTARIVVICGARRLRNIRVKYPPKEKSSN